MRKPKPPPEKKNTTEPIVVNTTTAPTSDNETEGNDNTNAGADQEKVTEAELFINPSSSVYYYFFTSHDVISFNIIKYLSFIQPSSEETTSEEGEGAKKTKAGDGTATDDSEL